MSNRPYWQGVFPAITTQFKKDQTLDLVATERHVEALIHSGVTGIIFLGSLGENQSMTAEEKRAARKERRAKKQQEAAGIAKQGDTGDKMAQQQKDKADAAAAKAQPKALPDAKAKQDALKEQTKKASGQ